MANPKNTLYRWLMLLGCTVWHLSLYGTSLTPPPPANDNCANAIPIPISGAGYDYGTFTSETSDLSMATAQAGEYFAESGHTRSVWYEFSVPTHRSLSVDMGGINLENVAVTVYEPTTCLPSSNFLTGTLLANGGGDITNSCSRVGLYRVQVTGPANSLASVFIILTLACPSASTSLYDCPADAFEFNAGNPLTQFQVSTGNHDIECQSLDEQTENSCLPIANRADFLQSSWYVFTTGSSVDLLIFYFGIGSNSDRAGYRLLEGNVRNTPPGTLPLITCGMATPDNHTRHIEFPCLLKPNTTYSLSLLFHKDFNRVINLSAQQRGVSATGWPMPVLPPVLASNQLGALPESVAGTTTVWTDRYDCSSYIIDNVCPPANPNSGIVTIGTGIDARRFDLATWATFTITEDAHVQFEINSGIFFGDFQTRIFSSTLGNTCPSPNPATDMLFEFSGRNFEYKCMPAGDYSIQILSSSVDPNSQTGGFDEAWTYGLLGTQFTMDFTVFALPSIGLFRLDAPGNFNAINNMGALQENILYPSLPAVFICDNTVIPDNVTCPNVEKAIYREAVIGDANADGTDDSGLLSITRLRTDTTAQGQIVYSFTEGDANQLATAAGTHAAGEEIPGLVDYPGFCINQDDNTLFPDGIDRFCVCVTPGTYTLASLGNEDHVGMGDNPGFVFNVHKTIHDSRPNAELINVGVNLPASYTSGPDVFSCDDNLGNMPPCGRRKKLVFREFYLPVPALVTVSETGNTTSVISLFSGQASHPDSILTLLGGCVPGFVQLYDPCNPLPAGWYTVVSYGEGPNYTDNRVWNTNPISTTEYQGDPRDVGKTTRIVLTLEPPIIPNYNRPDIAYQGGVTDWTTPPASNPNLTTWNIYQFPRDTFCQPDTPFISDSLLPCAPGYNRISFYVFEITKPSFVQIRNINPTFYTEVFPFDVNAQPELLLTVPPVYECLSAGIYYRQICDLPPGKYTIAIFANDTHEGASIGPAIYVDEAEESRFDHVWNAYDFDQIPRTNVFVNGKSGDVNPIPNQAPSRDKFYCTTGATSRDPVHTRCAVQLNQLIYGQPPGVPKPQFLTGQPPNPVSQPWRNLWYTFELSGSGVCTIQTQVLSGVNRQPLIAVYESDADASISWASLQAHLASPQDSILPGLKLIRENVDNFCDADLPQMTFTKSGCLRDSVRYYIVATFDADDAPNPPANPNQAISVSIKYDPKPTYIALYDERTTANVINGFVETAPPYTDQPLATGNTFFSTDFSLLCYTRGSTDPFTSLTCLETGKSAWFKFEVEDEGQFYTALEKTGGSSGWHTDARDISVWRENAPGSPLTQYLDLTAQFVAADNHSWLRSCIEPGTYYMMVRHCGLSIDTIQSYRVVMKLTETPGDFCKNAIPLIVPNFTPVSATVVPDCHTIGTDYGEFSAIGMGCLYEPIQQKTSWFRVSVNAAPEMDITFELTENLDLVDMDKLSYRVFSGSCGALTPISCSSIGSNIITQRCLSPGDYYVQIALPERIGNESVTGTIVLTITTANNTDPDCIPVDVNQPLADFTYTTDCETVSFNNISTAGEDITYLWEFPDSTSTDPNPVWTPTTGMGSFPVTLTVTNTALNTSTTVTINVTINEAFGNYIPLQDASICNDEGPVTIDATVPGPGVATYRWDNNSTNPVRAISTAGSYWVRITKDGCEILDTVVVSTISAKRDIATTVCANESIVVSGQVFDKDNPSGSVIIPNAHPSGCDSILTVNLSFYPLSGIQFAETICDGDSYLFDAQQLTTSGNYKDTLINVTGCDSIVTLTLTVTPQEIHDHDVRGCIGETLTIQPAVSSVGYIWNTGSPDDFLLVSSPGNYVVSVSDAAGCIVSIETFVVSFGLLATPIVAAPDPVCVGEEVLLTASGSTYEYRWFDAATGGNQLGVGATLLVSNILRDSLVFVEAFHVSIDGCVSDRAQVLIEVIEEMIQTATLDTLICFGNAVQLPWGEIVTPEVNSSYSYAWQSALTGCDSLILTVNVDLEDKPSLTLPAEHTLYLGDSILLIPQLDFQPDSTEWTPAEGLNCTDCLQPWAQPVRNTDYVLTLWTQEGCIVTATVHIEVDKNIRVYFPNVFSPNGDDVNDKFTVSGLRDLIFVKTLVVYDRWGGALWEGKDFIADGTIGWDGYSRGKEAPSGVYVWTCEIELIDGSRAVFSGDVTLVR